MLESGVSAEKDRALIVMLRYVLKTVALLTLAAFAVQAQSAPGAAQEKTATRKQHKLSKKQKVSKKAPVVTPPPPPPAPPAPKTPAEMPPAPPKVTYENGLLTIDAPNSTLGAVLEAVQRATGAEMDPVQASDRVMVHIGPGNPKDVLAALLSGSRYDYVILGSTANPDAIQRIILTSGSNLPVTPPQQAGFVANQQAEEQPEEEQQAPQYRPVPRPSRPFQAPPMPPDQTASPRQQPEGNTQNPDGTRTPQQLFNELRRMEQQRAQEQMKQQKQNPQ